MCAALIVRAHTRRRAIRQIDFDGIGATALLNAREICERVAPGGRFIGSEYTARNPKRDDRRPGSFRVNTRTGRWADFATDARGGDLISLFAWRYGLSQSAAARRLADFLDINAEVSR